MSIDSFAKLSMKRADFFFVMSWLRWTIDGNSYYQTILISFYGFSDHRAAPLQ
jgi:hypothetical protein